MKNLIKTLTEGIHTARHEAPEAKSWRNSIGVLLSRAEAEELLELLAELEERRPTPRDKPLCMECHNEGGTHSPSGYSRCSQGCEIPD